MQRLTTRFETNIHEICSTPSCRMATRTLPAGVACGVHWSLGALRCRDRQLKERIIDMLVVHNMSAPPRTEVRAEMRRVGDRIVIFSLVLP